jgi:hypothetical protein
VTVAVALQRASSPCYYSSCSLDASLRQYCVSFPMLNTYHVIKFTHTCSLGLMNANFYIGRPQRLEEPVTTGRISSDTNPNSPAKTTAGPNLIGVGPSFGESKLNITFCTAPWICVEPHPCYCCVMPKKCYISMEECRANCLNCDPKCPAAQTRQG